MNTRPTIKIKTQNKCQYANLDIVLIEDSHLIYDLLAVILKDLNVGHLTHHKLAKEGLSDIKQRYRSIDIVYLDISLPDSNGLELIPKIHKIDPNMHIVILSAHSSFDNVKNALKAGAKGFIAKPFSPQKIIDSLTNYFKLQHD